MTDVIEKAPKTPEGVEEAVAEIKRVLARDTDTCDTGRCPLVGGKTRANAKAEANRLGRPDIAALI